MSDTTERGPVVLDPPYKQAVVDALEEFEYGEVIPRKWLEEHFEVDFSTITNADDARRLSFKFMTAMENFRDGLLIDHQKMLQNVRGKGYLLVHPTAQTKEAITEYARSLKKANRVVTKSLSNIRLDMLDARQQQENHEARGKVSAVNAMAKERLRLGKRSNAGKKKLPKKD